MKSSDRRIGFMKEQQELEWLRYFYSISDFGPADSDVRYLIKQSYIKDGHKLPEGYELESE